MLERKGWKHGALTMDLSSDQGACSAYAVELDSAIKVCLIVLVTHIEHEATVGEAFIVA